MRLFQKRSLQNTLWIIQKFEKALGYTKEDSAELIGNIKKNINKVTGMGMEIQTVHIVEIYEDGEAIEVDVMVDDKGNVIDRKATEIQELDVKQIMDI